MKTLISGMAAAALAIAPMACNESPKGGAVTSNRESTTTKETFTIKAPSGHTTIKQGESKIIDVSLDRSSNFKQDVKLEAMSAETGKGVTIDPTSKSVAASDTAKISMTVKAEKDAAIGDHIIKITGTPASGAPTTVDVTIRVEEVKK